ncbi:MAG: cytochrome P450 [Acidimicrobiales bacterium]
MGGAMEPKQIQSVDEIDLSDLEFWTRPLEEREGAFKTLRYERPLAFFEEPDPGVDFIQRGAGYYAVTRHADILAASKQPEIFCSGQGATSPLDMPPELLEFFGSMINLDDPRHTRLRRIVAAGFTPKMLRQVEDAVQASAEQIVTDVLDRGSIDFVTEVAAKLPLKIICDMMGIPPSQYDDVFNHSNVILSNGDPEYIPGAHEDPSKVVTALFESGLALQQMVQELGEHRRKQPTDDLTSALVNASVDGEQLTQQELGSFFILLVVAGNETTRNAISHGLEQLTLHPDQRAIWAADFEAVAPTAVEEIVRWASPVIFMRRTATRDTQLGGQPISAGSKLLLFYNSANRDEAVFADPFRFDVLRQPNPHVGFGGPGPHFCLGAHLARREITVMFRELFRRVPDIAMTGEPDRLRSSFINGIKHLPAGFTKVA